MRLCGSSQGSRFSVHTLSSVVILNRLLVPAIEIPPGLFNITIDERVWTLKREPYELPQSLSI